MKIRKLLALLCAGILTVGTFTACSGETATTSAITTVTSAETSADEASATAEATTSTSTEATTSDAAEVTATEATETTTAEASADTTAADTTAAETTTEEEMTTTTATTTAATEATTAATTTAKAEASAPTLVTKATDVTLTADSVKLIGRTYLDGDTLWAALSGAGAEFVYTGKKLEVTFVGDNAAATANNNTNYARVGVYVDGVRVVDTMLDAKEKTVTAFESSAAKTVTVQIIKLSECAMSTCGIKPIHIEKGEGIAPTAAKQYKIEFIGDSITCGYGVDDEVKEHHFSTETEDVTKAYAYKTAQALGVDYSMFSISGYGIISGYTDDGTIKSTQTLPQYYESLGFSYQQFAGTTAPQSLDWDFSSYQPDVVVINLGTNDNSYCKDDEKKAVFQAAYLEFIKTVRKNNPNATIMCTLGLMGGDVSKNIKLAVDEYTAETGDTNITMFRITQQSSSNGYAADWHPTEKSHTKAAEAVIKQIKQQMGW